MSRGRYCEPVDIGDGIIVRAQLTKPRSAFTDEQWTKLVDALREIHQIGARRLDEEQNT